mmetsp:Transcript_88212/g.257847  ORF Transcript_88212/g.257847 Transcript_88212/m.257847 type:complete len:378 (-) Transcript_88212:138-1271(-)
MADIDVEVSPTHAHPQVQLCDSLFCRSQVSIEEQREQFEGKEDYESLRFRLQTRKSSIIVRTREVDRFLNMMRERGGGNIALAWRRYFDNDGDGELSFVEFCRALASLQYKGDLPGLWRDLGGSASNTLGLEALDPENAAILETFSRWCIATLGGPVEVFRAIDQDMSDSLTASEFAAGLRDLGFFSFASLPATLVTEELVLANLFPLLDQSGHGCITPDQLLFLEKDKEKRARIERQLARIREHGADGAPEPLRKDAERFLHNLSFHTTYLGGKHWTLIRESILEDPARYCRVSPTEESRRKSRRSTKGLLGGRASRSLSRSSSALLPRGGRSPGEVRLPPVGGHRAEAPRRELGRSASSSAVTNLPALEGSSTIG